MLLALWRFGGCCKLPGEEEWKKKKKMCDRLLKEHVGGRCEANGTLCGADRPTCQFDFKMSVEPGQCAE